jgi:hypothetical protein
MFAMWCRSVIDFSRSFALYDLHDKVVQYQSVWKWQKERANLVAHELLADVVWDDTVRGAGRARFTFAGLRSARGPWVSSRTLCSVGMLGPRTCQFHLQGRVRVPLQVLGRYQ